jgi:DNA-binding MarR family transcriptional regulator
MDDGVVDHRANGGPPGDLDEAPAPGMLRDPTAGRRLPSAWRRYPPAGPAYLPIGAIPVIRQSNVWSAPNGSVRPKHQSHAKEPAITAANRSAVVDEVIAGYEALMQLLADSHAPEFLEINVTMPQAKLLYLLGAEGELHMADLVLRLGVSLSTISGLVDRVVDQGLASRREDAADRRQVVVALTPAGHDFIDRFRELNARQMRELLELLGDDDLGRVRDALSALADAATRLAHTEGSASPRPSAPARKDPA